MNYNHTAISQAFYSIRSVRSIRFVLFWLPGRISVSNSANCSAESYANEDAKCRPFIEWYPPNDRKSAITVYTLLTSRQKHFNWNPPEFRVDCLPLSFKLASIYGLEKRKYFALLYKTDCQCVQSG